ncbi:glycoside hydrolase [Linderina pennispora]|uniref:Glycoside hydrolase n=1 Tax=Linderina pennispora TaxID=61395 RepID=A0A1Y1W7M8_9FUNG|nr:glycoside hydrolase [Linderina pennispora]ORX69533.1 glycoside hydrolase [Linderina pennispora]
MTWPTENKVCDNAMSKRIGYFESWASNRTCGKYEVGDIDPQQFTHLHFAFADINADFAPNLNDNQAQQLGSMRKLKEINKSLKVILSVGGWAFNDPGPTQHRFSDLAASSEGRKKFNAVIATWIKQNLIDGVDIDWEYPTSPDHGGRPEDYENFVTWIKELREAVGSGSISISAPASPYYLKGYDIVALSKLVDYIVYMTYDLHGTWDANVKSAGPYLNPHANITEVNTAIKILERAGVKSDKILMGLGFYGRSFKMADSRCSTTGCKFTEGGAPGKCTNASGVLSYAEIAELKSIASDMRYEQDAMVNIMVYGDSNYVSYDDPASLKRKVMGAKSLCLAGTAMWAIDMDDKDGYQLSASAYLCP